MSSRRKLVIGIIAFVTITGITHFYRQHQRLDLRKMVNTPSHKINENSVQLMTSYVSLLDEGLEKGLIKQLKSSSSSTKERENILSIFDEEVPTLRDWQDEGTFLQKINYEKTLLYDFNGKNSNSSSEEAKKDKAFQLFSRNMISFSNNLSEINSFSSNPHKKAQQEFKFFTQRFLETYIADSKAHEFLGAFPDMRITYIYVLRYKDIDVSKDSDLSIETASTEDGASSSSEQNPSDSGSFGFIIGYPYIEFSGSDPSEFPDFRKRPWFMSFRETITRQVESKHTLIASDEGGQKGISKAYSDVETLELAESDRTRIFTTWHPFEIDGAKYLLCVDHMVIGNPSFSLKRHWSSLAYSTGPLTWMIILLSSALFGWSSDLWLKSDKSPRPTGALKGHFSAIKERETFVDREVRDLHSSTSKSTTKFLQFSSLLGGKSLNLNSGKEEKNTREVSETLKKTLDLSFENGVPPSHILVETWSIYQNHFLGKRKVEEVQLELPYNFKLGQSFLSIIRANTINENERGHRYNFDTLINHLKYHALTSNRKIIENLKQDFRPDKLVTQFPSDEEVRNARDICISLQNKEIGRSLFYEFSSLESIIYGNISNAYIVLSSKVFFHYKRRSRNELIQLFQIGSDPKATFYFIESKKDEFKNLYNELEDDVKGALEKVQSFKIFVQDGDTPYAFQKSNFSIIWNASRDQKGSLITHLFTDDSQKGLGWISAMEYDQYCFHAAFKHLESVGSQLLLSNYLS